MLENTQVPHRLSQSLECSLYAEVKTRSQGQNLLFYHVRFHFKNQLTLSEGYPTIITLNNLDQVSTLLTQFHDHTPNNIEERRKQRMNKMGELSQNPLELYINL